MYCVVLPWCRVEDEADDMQRLEGVWWCSVAPDAAASSLNAALLVVWDGEIVIVQLR